METSVSLCNLLESLQCTRIESVNNHVNYYRNERRCQININNIPFIACLADLELREEYLFYSPYYDYDVV